jgi:hypothetical protein
MKSPTRTVTSTSAFGNLSTTFSLILFGVFVQALISIYTGPAQDGKLISKEDTRTMSEPAKVSGLASREAQKDGTEDPSTIQNKFMVGYQGWYVYEACANSHLTETPSG